MGTFRMPSLGADMEAGTLVEWLKQPGDAIRRGDTIAVVETQKGAIEVEVFETGILDRLLLDVGATVPVGTAMAEIRGEGDLAPAVAAAPTARPAQPTPPAAPQPIAAGPPRAGGMAASPAARKFAEEYGLDLSAIQGTGPDGAIVYVDVEAALQRIGKVPTMPPPRAPAADGMRAAIAAAMARSKREIPHYYLGHAVDLTPAMEWLTQLNAGRKPEARVLLAALLLKAVSRAIAKYPEFNGRLTEGRFVPSPQVHVGMAIAMRGGGVIAPAVHDTDHLSLDQLMQRMHDLANRVRTGRYRSSELADATITLTSLGERGVDWVQPVIYPPQVAIVGAGTIRERAWAVDGKICVRQICDLTLAADHRVSDGHRGALFLRAIGNHLQAPEAL